jgi:hypothetical protein
MKNISFIKLKRLGRTINTDVTIEKRTGLPNKFKVLWVKVPKLRT